MQNGYSMLDISSSNRIQCNVSLSRHVLSRKPSSRLDYWTTTPLPSLPSIQLPLWNKCNATMHRTFSVQSWIIELPMSFSFKFLLWSKLKINHFVKYNLKRLAAAQFWSYVAIVTKTHGHSKCKSHSCSLLLYFHLVHNFLSPALNWHLPTHQDIFCKSKALTVSG